MFPPSMKRNNRTCHALAVTLGPLSKRREEGKGKLGKRIDARREARDGTKRDETKRSLFFFST